MKRDLRGSDDSSEEWYDRRMDESLNRWFVSYDEAERSLREFGGYLLPFRHQFVVCESAAIRALGMDPGDPDWNMIGWNVVRPADVIAFERLRRKRQEQRRSGRE